MMPWEQIPIGASPAVVVTAFGGVLNRPVSMAMAALTSMLAIAFFISRLARWPNSSCQRGLKIGSALIWAVSHAMAPSRSAAPPGRVVVVVGPSPPPPPSRPLAASMMPASASCGNTE